MAVKASSSHLEPDSTPGSSQSDLFGDSRLPRQLFRRGKAQDELLNRPDSWGSKLRNRALPLVNVPPEVLDNIRAFSIQQLQASQQEAPAQGSLDSSYHDAKELQRESAGTGPPASNCTPNSNVHSPEGTQLSWSPSPHHGQTDAPSSNNSTPTPRPNFLTQPPASSPTYPLISAKRRAFDEFPSSSPNAQEELEFEVPAAMPRLVLPTKLSTRTQFHDTPPSAQVEVPNTYDPSSCLAPGTKTIAQSPGKPSLKANPKQRPMGKAVIMPRKAQGLDPGSKRLNTTSLGFESSPEQPFDSTPESPVVPSTRFIDTQMDPSHTDLSSTLLPFPNAGPQAQERDIGSLQHALTSSELHPASISGPGSSPSPLASRYPLDFPLHGPSSLSPIKDLVMNGQHIPETQLSPQIVAKSPEFRSESPALVTSSPSRQSSPLQEPPIHTQPTALTQTQSGESVSSSIGGPFYNYAVAYPGYRGSLKDFVNACIILQELQREKRIASYLYDDFIRAWNEGFMPYVEASINGADRPMRAIEWYNEFVDEPSFTTQIVTKHNLEAIFDSYPEEATAGRKALEIRSGPSSPVVAEAVKPPLLRTRTVETKNPSSESTETSLQKQNIDNGEVSEPSMLRSPSSVKQMPPPGKPTTKSREPLEEGPNSGQPFSDIINRKRPADGDNKEGMKKRRSTGSVVEPLAGGTPRQSTTATVKTTSTIGRDTPPSSAQNAAKKRKSFQNPEERSRDLKRFLAKREERERRKRESILSSSAPELRTPTSAQME